MVSIRGFRSVLAQDIEHLTPASFALVMATGVVSIAAYKLDMTRLSLALFGINVVAYAVLWALNVARVVWYPRRALADLLDHTRGCGYYTVVAATCVLGSQFAILTLRVSIAAALWIAGLVLWLLLIYAFFTAVTMRESKPALENGINGAWLLVVVSTESIGVLGTLVAPALGATELVLLISFAVYLVGAMLYIPFITLILYRWMFFSFRVDVMTPSYWINMGALAIATLAGSRLLLAADQWSFLQELAPFVRGLTFLFWAVATWWIPLLVIVGIWRHIVKRVPLTYDPQYWALVFPLGMYAVATFMWIKATGLTVLSVIPQVFVPIALLAWLATFAGLVAHLLRSLLRLGAT